MKKRLKLVSILDFSLLAVSTISPTIVEARGGHGGGHGGLRLVEDYDPEPYMSTAKVLHFYESGLLYELDRGVVSLILAKTLDFETDFERYLQLVKEI